MTRCTTFISFLKFNSHTKYSKFAHAWMDWKVATEKEKKNLIIYFRIKRNLIDLTNSILILILNQTKFFLAQ